MKKWLQSFAECPRDCSSIRGRHGSLILRGFSLVAVLCWVVSPMFSPVFSQPEVGPCADVMGVDFGDCDMVMGYAQINGVCTLISGCGTTVNGVDYGPAFFEDEPTCTMCNEVPPACGLQLVVSTIDGMWYTFTAVDVPEGVTLQWYIADFLAQEGGDVFEAGFDFFPDWTVCVQYESDPCGGLVQQCYSNLEGVAACTDVAGVDFGLCSMPLGVAKVNGLCTFVSGCGTYVGGVNYGGAFFESMEDCALSCADGCVSEDLLILGQTIDCITLLDPVCGCDGLTYGNSCEAMYGGGVTSWTPGECPSEVSGCTYAWACNFSPAATLDDGSCLFPPLQCASEGGGCIYEEAMNYNPLAWYDDGSCEFELVAACPGDVNGDAAVTVDDILALLAVFGSECW